MYEFCSKFPTFCPAYLAGLRQGKSFYPKNLLGLLVFGQNRSDLFCQFFRTNHLVPVFFYQQDQCFSKLGMRNRCQGKVNRNNRTECLFYTFCLNFYASTVDYVIFSANNLESPVREQLNDIVGNKGFIADLWGVNNQCVIGR